MGSVKLAYRDEVPYVKFPRDIEDAKKLGAVLSRYKDKYFYQVHIIPFSVGPFSNVLLYLIQFSYYSSLLRVQ